jgi:DNA-binding transcriptional regulator YdaS (Cro superfamily)
MGVDRSNVSRWVSGSRDPSAEAVVAIRRALLGLRPPAAEEFVQAYLYDDSEIDITELRGTELRGTDFRSNILHHPAL